MSFRVGAHVGACARCVNLCPSWVFGRFESTRFSGRLAVPLEVLDRPLVVVADGFLLLLLLLLLYRRALCEPSLFLSPRNVAEG